VWREANHDEICTRTRVCGCGVAHSHTHPHTHEEIRRAEDSGRKSVKAARAVLERWLAAERSGSLGDILRSMVFFWGGFFLKQGRKNRYMDRAAS